MITGYVHGQTLKLSAPIIASDTVDYLEAQFLFRQRDWDGLSVIKAVFVHDETAHTIPLTDGRIRHEDHLNLAAGTWSVHLVGSAYVDGTLVQRITTAPDHLTVVPCGAVDGDPLPEMPATDAERLEARMEAAETALKERTDDKYVSSYRIISSVDGNTHTLYLIFTDKSELKIPLPQMGIDIDRVVKFGTEDPTENTYGETKQLYINTATGAAWVCENGQSWPVRWIPISGGGTVKSVNGVEPDENGNVQIPTGSDAAVLYTPQGLSEEQQMQARANMGLYATEQKPLKLAEIIYIYGQELADVTINNLNLPNSVQIEFERIYTGGSEIYAAGQEYYYDYGSDVTTYYYGNKSLVGRNTIGAHTEGTEDNGKPFLLCSANGKWQLIWDDSYLSEPDNGNMYNVYLYDATKTETVVHTVPDEYIPNTIARKSDLPESGGSGGTDISLSMTGAAVGQIAKITAVNENGAPTAWEPVDLPEGGEKWELIHSFTVPTAEQLASDNTGITWFADDSDNVYGFEITQKKDGTPFTCSKMYMYVLQGNTHSVTKSATIYANGKKVGAWANAQIPLLNRTGRIKVERYGNRYELSYAGLSANVSANNWYAAPTNTMEVNTDNITSFKMMFAADSPFPEGYVCTLWGVEA